MNLKHNPNQTENKSSVEGKKRSDLREIYTKKSYLFGLYKREITTKLTEKEYEKYILDKKMNDATGMLFDIMPIMAVAAGVGGIANAIKRKTK